ncbi:hypothetical protein [Streptomyces sp. NPDC055006]
MALYEVSRTDEIQPGEFVNATVIAGGVAQARGAVAHMDGVTKSNLSVVKVDLTGYVKVIGTYFDERPTLTPTLPGLATVSVAALTLDDVKR